ncbi:glycosyltransferase family 2 protein [Rahnella sp. Lac-M11]|uniref:Glycosyltransferase family 2 protein n=1 Tax=Rahnella contaminans TaxID=2703882 RepID=A0A6M2B230_9GAMM|nr:glycosyltransferase family A protein [Rahnella contaminans]MDF1894664.1 glycosyltransferase family A protein [Rahnella contaminans]NGX86783.1 glycosyltransferase family 2 protein [Rahnella contaminans]
MNIDILIPFKDAEAHLPNICYDLSQQTFNNFQVTFISDDSIDGSIEYLENTHFPFKSKILESTGQGPGTARNIGIRNTDFEYICFIDVDDRIETNFIEEFTSVAINHKPDIVECMFKSISPDGEIISGTHIENFISNKDRFLTLLDGSTPRLSWGKIYKREHLLNIDCFFPDGIHNGEDHIFLLNAYSSNPTVEIVLKKLYSWVRHPNSLTNRPPTEKTIEDFIKVSELKSDIFEKYKSYITDKNLSSLAFSRRFFKEARMLQLQIKAFPSTSGNLIVKLQQGILHSEKLKKRRDDIEHDATSYWKDVMTQF